MRAFMKMTIALMRICREQYWDLHVKYSLQPHLILQTYWVSQLHMILNICQLTVLPLILHLIQRIMH